MIADARRPLQALVEKWKEREAFIRQHLDFNIRNNNMPDDAEADAVRQCADELTAALAAAGAPQEEEQP